MTEDEIIQIQTDSETTVVADPHIFPFNGPKFDFMGQDGGYYNFISHDHIQINIRIRGQGFTVMSEVCLKARNNTVQIIAHDDEFAYLEVLVNNKRVKSGYDETFEDFTIKVTPQVVVLILEDFRFHIQKCSNSAHLYNKDPHLDMSAKLFSEYNGRIHGILGQSANPLFEKLEGEEEDYRVSGPFVNDSKSITF